MKRLVIASLLAAGVLGAQAQTFVDQARVLRVDPQYENVTQPRNECTSHWINERGGRYGGEPQARQYGGAIVGGLAGGVLGNQIGGGNGKKLATVVGAVGGAVVGNQVEGNMKASTSYQVQVRMDNGGSRTFNLQNLNGYNTGDRIKVVNGALRHAG